MGQAGSGLSGPGVRGLKNLDSTCYMNVGLQCLFQTPGLTALLQEQWNYKLNAAAPKRGGGQDQALSYSTTQALIGRETQSDDEKTGTVREQLRGGNDRESIVTKYLSLAEQVWDSRSEEVACVSPEELKRAIDQVEPRYRGCSKQRDAVDFFLNVFIKHLHADVRVPFSPAISPKLSHHTTAATKPNTNATNTKERRSREGKLKPTLPGSIRPRASAPSAPPGIIILDAKAERSSAAKLSKKERKKEEMSHEEMGGGEAASRVVRTPDSIGRNPGTRPGGDRASPSPPKSTSFLPRAPPSQRRSDVVSDGGPRDAGSIVNNDPEALRSSFSALLARVTPGKLEKTAETSWKRHLENHGRSFFTENFQGQSVRCVRCGQCGRRSIDFPVFQFLPISPPPNQESIRLVDMLPKLPRRHTLRGWRCPVCHAGRGSVRSLKEKVWRLPNVLMVLVQRVMKTKTNKLIKNKTEIWLPREGLDLSSLAQTRGVPTAEGLPPLPGAPRRRSRRRKGATETREGRASQDEGCMDYDLYAMLSHSGTPNRGHYIAHVRNFRSGVWHTFNDGNIKRWDAKQNIVKNSDVYVLFFHRKAFAREMGELKIPGEPLTFEEWKHAAHMGSRPFSTHNQCKAPSTGFFIANRAIKKHT